MKATMDEYPATDDHESSQSEVSDHEEEEEEQEEEQEQEEEEEEEEEVDESVVEDMRKLEETFEGISLRYRMINRIGEGLCFLYS